MVYPSSQNFPIPLNRFGCYPLEEGLIPHIEFSMTLQSNDLIPEQIYNPKQEVLYKLIVQLRSDGLSFIKISKRLNAWGIKTYRGHTWLPQSVHSILKKKSLSEQRIRTQRKKYFPVVISEFKLKYDYA
jgi:predicted nucleic acid-binding protein